MEVSPLYVVSALTLIFLQITVASVFKAESLYDSNDKVTVLNITNFKEKVLGSEKAWIIEFYSSWCGHCINFAPTWKELAQDVAAWRDIMCVAGVDCALDANNPLCRDYDVMAYPTIKLFEPGTKEGMLGVKWEGDKTVHKLRSAMIDYLSSQKENGKGASWPDLSPYMDGKLDSLWRTASKNTKYAALIFEDMQSYTGREVILDMSTDPRIHIRRVLPSNKLLVRKLNIESFPLLVIIDRNLKPLSGIPVQIHTRIGFVQALQKFLNYPEPSADKDKKTDIRIMTDKGSKAEKGQAGLEERENEGVGAADGQGEEQEDEEAVSDEKQLFGKGGIQETEEDRDHVFMGDLEMAVRYSLFHEVGMHKVIAGDSFKALQDYITVLKKYFPGRAPVVHFIQKMWDWVMKRDDVIQGENFVNFLTELDKQTGSFSATPADWIGCKGSRGKFRGYPCGLWSLFHTLTVSSVALGGSDPNFESLEVLKTMVGYIKNFFGCKECSLNFQKMAAESMSEEVILPEHSILWLWKAHNKVNKRLSGDPSEDPKHPKIQYPSKERCESCVSEARGWDLDEVLAYVKQVYSRDSLSFQGISISHNMKSLDKNFLNNRQSGVKTKLEEEFRRSWKKKRYGNEKNKSKIKDLTVYKNENIISENVKGSVKGASPASAVTGWGFNVTDISLCVLLYFLSGTILILFYVRFIMKRRYKKKPYIYDLFGKV